MEITTEDGQELARLLRFMASGADDAIGEDAVVQARDWADKLNPPEPVAGDKVSVLGVHRATTYMVRAVVDCYAWICESADPLGGGFIVALDGLTVLPPSPPQYVGPNPDTTSGPEE